MKKGLMIIVFTVFFIQFALATCTLTPTLINQDPISAVPGETVRLLFQITGTENPECGNINLEFIEEYPFTLDSGYNKLQSIQGGTYQRDFNSFWVVPYKIRVDKNALDGEQKVSLKTSVEENSQLVKVIDFNVSVEEVRTDFIVTIDSYSFSTKKLSLGIVNIGKKNAQAITVEIPQQEKALIEGGHTKIIGDIDSNEDTTVSFDSVLNSGIIKVNLQYNDEIGERRTLTKEILFSEDAFENTKKKSSISVGQIILWLAVIGIIVYLYLSRRKAHLHIKHLTRNRQGQ